MNVLEANLDVELMVRKKLEVERNELESDRKN